jgi:hypothetical protein
MEQKLTKLLTSPGFGQRVELVVQAKERLLSAVPDGCDLRLDGTDVAQAITCGGFWESAQQTSDMPPPVSWLHMHLAGRMAIEFVEATVAGHAQRPADFVHEMLTADGRHDALTATWLLLINLDDRAELCRTLTMMLDRFASSWSTMATDSRIRFGPMAAEAVLGGLTLAAGHVDMTLDGGDGRTVLLAITPGAACEMMFDSLGVETVLHALAAGSPPARVVGWGVAAGRGVAVDVTDRWFEDRVSHIAIAARRIAEIRDEHRIQLDPGPHCMSCPIGNVCEISEADQHSPF